MDNKQKQAKKGALSRLKDLFRPSPEAKVKTMELRTLSDEQKKDKEELRKLLGM